LQIISSAMKEISYTLLYAQCDLKGKLE